MSDDSLTISLSDGRSVSVPLAWYPRLVHGTPEERNNWRMIGNNEGVHWPDLDEDISVGNLLMGQRAGEKSGIIQTVVEKANASRSRLAKSANHKSQVKSALPSLRFVRKFVYTTFDLKSSSWKQNSRSLLRKTNRLRARRSLKP